MSEIMVVRKDLLFKEKYFEGFLEFKEYDFIKKILENYEFKEREKVERNLKYKQPIVYGVIINGLENKIFLYCRGGKGYKEKRLENKLSIGIGGHIEKSDGKDYFLNSLVREIKEEVKINGNVNFYPFGYINDESNEVSKVHFGIVYLINVKFGKIIAKNEEIKYGVMEKFDKIEKVLKEKGENWSRILIRPLKKYFKQ